VLVIICCLTSGLFSCALMSPNVKTRFFEAESCCKSMDQNPKQKRYRSYWLNCINKFMAVHDAEPSGPWAAAALYRAGLLYRELSRYSGRDADYRTAGDIFQQIMADYPKSAYSDKAKNQLAEMSLETKQQRAPAIDIQTIKNKYFEAETCYRDLRASKARKKYRCYWLDCIKAFNDVYQSDPDGPWAAAGLYMAGKLYGELYKYSYKEDDREEGHRLLQKVVNEFPGSAYRKKAADELDGDDVTGVLTAVREPDTVAEEDDLPTDFPLSVADTTAPGTVVVKELRYWSNPSYTRVVIDTTGPAEFNHNLLKSDPKSGKPPRLYIDLQDSRLHQELSRQITIDDNLLKDIRAGQFTNNCVRVVVDIKSFKSYKIFSLRDPFRVVIDVSGEGEVATVAGTADSAKVPGETGKTSLAKQLGLTVRRIVIDPGHGGKDGGAPGCIKGIHEKKVVLDLSRMLAERIRKELGCEVIMTRSDDKFLTLEERTAIANMKNADLFISIHTNACRAGDAYGIETYILNLATDEDAMRVAAMENSTSQKNISDLQTILRDLMQNAKINESSRLAGYVQNSLCGYLKKRYKRINDKGVKQAPFYVLIGAQMPSILIETGFISNRDECRRLTDDDYQKHLCEGILEGIRAYIKHTTSAGFSPPTNVMRTASVDAP
jgi:N-acetylmuramoyl-L-alanine amidase